MKIGPDTPVVVSGGASGLGAAVAKSFADIGVGVAILDMNADLGAAYAKEIGAAFIQTDVSDSQSVAAALETATAQNGVARIAVNCAGIAPAAKTVSRGAAHDPAIFNKVIGVNLIGSFNLASQSAALMAAADPIGADGEKGVIVNTASVAAYEAQIGQIAYGASKGGVVGMTLPMARDLSQHGIRVCSISPGMMKTAMMDGFPQEVQDSLAANIPYPSRLGHASEFAALVHHIAENSYLNGETIRLDGATRMQPR
ncbi:MAG: SDR family NAD(P)-dependent oxidoreductase [Pseudomonadota bacterium]